MRSGARGLAHLSGMNHALGLATVSAFFALACQKHAEPPAPVASSAPSAKPLDHLAPGELAQGPGQVFGFAVPGQMKVLGAFLEVAYLQGEVTPEALANYVRERVDVDRVEIGAVSTVFPRVHIKSGDQQRIYDFDITPSNGRTTELVIRDVTPQPKNPPGTSDAERWRQAGYGPDGKPLDMNLLK
jgi:hypothetical protein